MATIHRTTMKPTKLELLTEWLPRQKWFEGNTAAPELANAGGFRLDDPEGLVGIEFMVVTDASGGAPVAYLVPLSYRGAALDGAPDEALIGTSEHGVLGTRWIYDGAHDPTLMGELAALLRGDAAPQQQNESDAPDPSVTVQGHDREGAQVGDRGGNEIRLHRVLRPAEAAHEPPVHLTAGWSWPDGTPARGVFASIGSR
ncbi:1,4-alpha-glucan branching protein [Streptomyces sp. NPDC091272]|uniref:maltokinase N-terminal cap-like domain-containing protein n=1 Tax=Streptomyces sp. NPDC091272 TaxID=3365981 RepID=UPI0037F11B5F